MIKQKEIDFYRYIYPGFSEFVETVVFNYTSKTNLIKQIRQYKKKISGLCKYKTTGDTIYYKECA